HETPPTASRCPPADPRDRVPRDRLLVRDDRERLERRLREPDVARGQHELLDHRRGPRMGGEPPPAGDVAERDPGATVVVATGELLAPRVHLGALGTQGLGEHRRGHGLVRDEQQRLEGAKRRRLVVHAASPSHRTSISPKVAACARSTLPSRYSSSSARNRTTIWIRSSQSATRARGGGG